MTTKLMQLEKIAREILEKNDLILKSGCDVCEMCSDHRMLLLRSDLQTRFLLRGLVNYLEKIKEDRREKRRRHKENKNLRQY